MAESSATLVAPFILWIGNLLFSPGLPIALPPLPEDQTLQKIAPDDCLVYFYSSGMGKADAKSANQVEQLCAEAEIRTFASSLERTLVG